MKTAKEWMDELPIDLEADGKFLERRVAYTENRIKAIQVEAVEWAISQIESYQREVWRVDSKEAEVTRMINCFIRQKLTDLERVTP